MDNYGIPESDHAKTDIGGEKELDRTEEEQDHAVQHPKKYGKFFRTFHHSFQKKSQSIINSQNYFYYYFTYTIFL